MEDTGRLTPVTLPKEELDMLTQVQAARIVEEQQQQALTKRQTHELTASTTGHHSGYRDRADHVSAWGQNNKSTDTYGEAPNASIPFHRELFQTPSEE